MPIYSDMDDRFNAALANKLKVQDSTAYANTTNANANMMGAQSQAAQVDSLNEYRRAGSEIGMAEAGTHRMATAGELPMGLSSDQVNSMGLRGFGITPTATATSNLRGIYGDGSYSQESPYLMNQKKMMGTPNATTAAAPPSSMTSVQAWNQLATPQPAAGWQGGAGFDQDRQKRMGRMARGGMIGDRHDPSHADNRLVLAHPREFMLSEKAVTHGFGDGDYDTGLRNLNEIVRQSTGQEPGATYSKKAPAGYARSGSIPALPNEPRGGQAWMSADGRSGGMGPSFPPDGLHGGGLPGPRRMPGEIDQEDQAQPEQYLDGRDAVLQRLEQRNTDAMLARIKGMAGPSPHNMVTPYRPNAPAYQDGRDAVLARQAAGITTPVQVPVAPPAGRGMSTGQWNRMVDNTPVSKTGYPMFANSGQVPGLDYAKAGGAKMLDQMRRLKFAQAAGTGLRTLATTVPVAIGEKFERGDYNPIPQIEALADFPQQLPGAGMAGDFLSGVTGTESNVNRGPHAAAARGEATTSMRNRFGPQAPGAPDVSGLAAELAGAQPPVPSLRDMVQEQAASPNIGPEIKTIRNTDSDGWATQRAMAGGGVPGQQLQLDYGVGHGGGPNAPPIVAIAGKNGKYNSFGGTGLRMAHGGQIPSFTKGGPISKVSRNTNPVEWTTYEPEPGLEDLLAGEAEANAQQRAALQEEVGQRFTEENTPRRAGAPSSAAPESAAPAAGVAEAEKPGVIQGLINKGRKALGFGGKEGASVDPNATLLSPEEAEAKYGSEMKKNRAAMAKDDLNEARRSGKNFRAAFTEPVDVKAGLRRAGEIAKTVAEPAGKGLGMLGRGAGYLAPLIEAGSVADVMTDPKKSWGDVGSQAGSSVGKLAAAGIGAAGGGVIGGAMVPLVGAPIGAIAGGIGGYFAGEKGIEKVRGMLGASNVEDPYYSSYGKVKQMLGIKDPNAGPPKPTRMDTVPFMQASQMAIERGAERGAGLRSASQAAQGAQQEPDLRDQMLRYALSMRGGSKVAQGEQANILNYLASTDPNRGGGGLSAAAQARKAQSDHEKDIEESLKTRFKKTVIDPKTKEEKSIDDNAAFERFRADMIAHKVPIYDMSRTERDAYLSEWQERDAPGQRIKGLQGAAGDTAQLVSDRTRPMQLKNNISFGDWMGNSTVPIGAYAKSFLGGKGLRNQLIQAPVKDPRTGEIVQRSFPAEAVLTNPDGTINYDQLQHVLPPSR